MTLEEKIAQKIVMSFRYWCDDGNAECTDGLTEINDSVRHVIEHNKVGGVILFSSNLVDTDQTAELIWNMQDAVEDEQPVGLFMTIDQEGGSVVRLPREDATNLPGNMALGSAYLNSGDSQLAYDAGKVLATEIGSVGFNVNFAPVVDVQSNPLNPVINVRSYGEDPEAVGILGGQAAQGMAAANVIGAFKHFPGHGDTKDDSHYGLPIVFNTLEEAHAIDLAPYKTAIEQGVAPDMIMTAHIQYPALDSSFITSSETGKEMLVPATLSYKIQTELLREELNYQGLTITDALDMAGIADYFGEAEAVIKTFQAGVDIALMPTLFRTTSGENQLTELIDEVVEAVELGELSEADIDRSVERIITKKLERNILNHNGAQPLTDIQSQAQEIIGNDEHQAIEKNITEKSVTLISNQKYGSPMLPLDKDAIGKVHVLMPAPEISESSDGSKEKALEAALKQYGVTEVTTGQIGGRLLEIDTNYIDNADTVIVGTLATNPTPVGDQGHYAGKNKTATNDSRSLVFNEVNPFCDGCFDKNEIAYNAMQYAHEQNKNVIHLTLRAPYDVVNYEDVSHSAIATYNFYGTNADGEDLGANAMDAAARVILGDLNPAGKLPVNIFEQNEDGEMGDLKYEIGHGLSYPQ
ncbi:beta-hexosaminidase [Vibrio coralliilyticus]|nr:glycoside hydrolase family 3 protein [Vibrio sp. SCSIO 43186]USD48437.1 glycoside hydrolase family 3 protein [Vibrio sp. SCSIO 43145]USD72494.1 glycoside hydrolase family 3 protein [Vibrio sp. SCSIO 43139]USD98777.1 beta-hexosaminidase [Vibrio coralliilyticus]